MSLAIELGTRDGRMSSPKFVLVLVNRLLAEDLDGQELLEVGDGGEAGHPHELPLQLGQGAGVRAGQEQVHLLVKPGGWGW